MEIEISWIHPTPAISTLNRCLHFCQISLYLRGVRETDEVTSKQH